MRTDSAQGVTLLFLIWIKIGNDPPRIVTSIQRRLAQTEQTRFQREAGMSNLKSLGVVVALSVALPLGIADMAFAAKKKPPEHLTYEQAWAICKAHVDKLAADQQSQRYSRGAACMYAYGFRI
jgi:hypothetical protein